MTQVSNDSVACIPWFYPTPANLSLYVCNPWETVKFLGFMSKVPAGVCQCLPDCSAIIYEPIIISTPLRKCDSSSLGVSKLCDINNKALPQPTMFGSQARLEFERYGCSSSALNGVESSTRFYANTLPNGDVFGTNPKNYSAFEKDIALVEVYFRKSNIFQMGRQARMNWIDYFSTVGGLLGLVLGMGIISIIELIWVCLRLAALKMNFQNLIP